MTQCQIGARWSLQIAFIPTDSGYPAESHTPGVHAISTRGLETGPMTEVEQNPVADWRPDSVFRRPLPLQQEPCLTKRAFLLAMS